jgi:excisionase family DNA binding protein
VYVRRCQPSWDSSRAFLAGGGKPKNMTGEYLVRVEDACTRLGIGRTKLYERINSGELQATKIDNRTLIVGSSIDRFIARTIGEAA